MEVASDNVRHADNQQVTNGKRISDEYFSGFVDGEGCFYVGFSKREDLPLKWQIITEFHLSQNPGGKNILEAFRQRLGCGYIKLNHPRSLRDKSWVFIVKKRNELQGKLVPFFKKYMLHSQKKDDFLIFTKVLEIIETGEHLKYEGFKKIVNLVFRIAKATNKKYTKEMLLSTGNLRDYTPDSRKRKDIVRTV